MQLVIGRVDTFVLSGNVVVLTWAVELKWSGHRKVTEDGTSAYCGMYLHFLGCPQNPSQTIFE